MKRKSEDNYSAQNSKRLKVTSVIEKPLIVNPMMCNENFLSNRSNTIGDYDFLDTQLYTEEGQQFYFKLTAAVVDNDISTIKNLFEQSLVSLFSLESKANENHNLNNTDYISKIFNNIDINNALLTPAKRPSLLHLAAQQGGDQIIKELVSKHQADINIRNLNGETPLHIAAKTDKASTIETLIELKADIEAQDIDGNTPLMMATRAGHQKSIHVLLRLKADINATNYNGTTPLHTLLHASYVDILLIKSLLNHSCGTEIKDSIKNIRPIIAKEIDNIEAEVIVNQNERSIICDKGLTATNILTVTEDVKTIGNSSEIKIDLADWDKD
ncbi:MAG: ankyrin repeat domain-containing protein [Rickettsiaceae bacterium]|nr:MAG: ankyrin repeat domain-containing protein [Rickettsiaceae bacterium]